MFIAGLLLFSAASLAGGLAAGFDRGFLVAAAIALLMLVVAIAPA